jgi:SRSO17 transposase
LDLWASSLRAVKERMRPLFTQDRVAASAHAFLDGLLGPERRKTGWMIAWTRAQRSPHFALVKSGLNRPAFETASLNFSISGASLCSGMFGMSS